MDMFPTIGRVDMFPSTDDINLINSTHVETVALLQRTVSTTKFALSGK